MTGQLVVSRSKRVGVPGQHVVDRTLTGGLTVCVPSQQVAGWALERGGTCGCAAGPVTSGRAAGG